MSGSEDATIANLQRHVRCVRHGRTTVLRTTTAENHGMPWTGIATGCVEAETKARLRASVTSTSGRNRPRDDLHQLAPKSMNTVRLVQKYVEYGRSIYSGNTGISEDSASRRV